MQHSTSRLSIFCSNKFISHALSHKFISRAMLHPRVKKACETPTCGSELSVCVKCLHFFQQTYRPMHMNCTLTFSQYNYRIVQSNPLMFLRWHGSPSRLQQNNYAFPFLTSKLSSNTKTTQTNCLRGLMRKFAN